MTTYSDEFIQGYTAQKNGYSRTGCPWNAGYPQQRRDWLAGWDEASARAGVRAG